MKKAEQEIKDLLKQTNTSSYRVCKDLGILQGTMSRYLSGQRQMPAGMYLEVKEYLLNKS